MQVDHVWLDVKRTWSVLCRLVRTDVSARSTDVAWEEVIPEHPSDLLQWAVALKVRALFSPACNNSGAMALGVKICALSGRKHLAQHFHSPDHPDLHRRKDLWVSHHYAALPWACKYISITSGACRAVRWWRGTCTTWRRCCSRGAWRAACFERLSP